MSAEFFPTPFIGLGYREGPEHQTNIVVSFGGHEQRNDDWATPLRRFFVPLTDMPDIERTEILAFVDRMKGRFDNFFFESPLTGTLYRCRLNTDRAEIEARFYDLHYWPDLELIETRDETG